MGRKPIPQRELDANERICKYQADSQVVGRSITKGLSCLTYIGIAFAICYFAYKSIVDLSGKTTYADIKVNFLSRFDNSNIIPYIIIGALFLAVIILLIWAFVERNLRKKSIQRLTKRTRKLETQINPNRTSSNLTDRGETAGGDKW